MNVNNKPDKQLLKIYGSGWNRAPWIISYMPTHDNYLEPCFGGGNIFLRKPPARLETINDINGRVVNAFQIIRDRPDEFARALDLTPWAEEEFNLSHEPSEDPLEDARRFWVWSWMAITYGSGFRYHKKPESRYTLAPEDGIGLYHIYDCARRLKKAQIMQRDALELIDDFRSTNALIYFDPPYLTKTRVRKKGYDHEVTDQWHMNAAKLLRWHEGPVIISGYKSHMYEYLYEQHGWTRIEREFQTQSGKKQVECIWLNRICQQQLEEDLPLLKRIIENQK